MTCKNQVQDEFFVELMNTQLGVNIFLINGIKLKGKVCSVDDHIIILKNHDNDGKQLIYKHAVSTVLPTD
jgi:host factor-I protein